MTAANVDFGTVAKILRSSAYKREVESNADVQVH